MLKCSMHCTHLLACPFCNASLTQINNTLTCTNSHTFDIAKEGYVNLLRKKLPGDTKEMLIARRNFLEQGYYQPLSDTINALVSTALGPETPPFNILDAGCGEGYYLGRLQQRLVNRFPHAQCCYMGLDISKEAIRMAAKKYKAIQFVVANLKERLVFVDSAFHALLNIFAPRNVDEFTRVLIPGGIAIIVIPAPTHLSQLRSTFHLLNIEENKQQHVIEQFSSRFELTDLRTIEYKVRLSQGAMIQAILMTPNYWHLPGELKEAAEGIEEMETEVGFVCMVFRRHA
ncbi:MAG TPA: methyltransferase domain-containing protein [Ktedonobacteraceae bacterium]|nr:methyltransferase domain-containing protein [Ktedonobacteraceae bacterium]